jgi:hypothetical protein
MGSSPLPVNHFSSSSERRHYLAHSFLNGKLSVEEAAAAGWQLTVYFDLGQQLQSQLQQFVNLVAFTNLSYLLGANHLRQIITRIDVRQNWQATLHVGEELAGDVVRFVPWV